MLFTLSLNELRSCPLSWRFHDNDGGGLPLTIQVKSTCSPSSPGIWVLVGVDVTMIGRAVRKKLFSSLFKLCKAFFWLINFFSAFWCFTINFRNYATFEGFLDKQYFSLHTRFFAESKLEALSNARRPAVCKASGKPLTGLLPASVAQSIKLICRRKTGSYCRTNDESLLAG